MSGAHQKWAMCHFRNEYSTLFSIHHYTHCMPWCIPLHITCLSTHHYTHYMPLYTSHALVHTICFSTHLIFHSLVHTIYKYLGVHAPTHLICLRTSTTTTNPTYLSAHHYSCSLVHHYSLGSHHYTSYSYAMIHTTCLGTPHMPWYTTHALVHHTCLGTYTLE